MNYSYGIFYSTQCIQCEAYIKRQYFNTAAVQCYNSDMKPIKQNVCLIFINMENKWKTVLPFFPLKMVYCAFLFMAEAKNIITWK